jgi:hypothetical protein
MLSLEKRSFIFNQTVQGSMMTFYSSAGSLAYHSSSSSSSSSNLSLFIYLFLKAKGNTG